MYIHVSTSACNYCDEDTQYGLELLEDGTIVRCVTGCGGYQGTRYDGNNEVVPRDTAIAELEEGRSVLREQVQEMKSRIAQMCLLLEQLRSAK